MVSIAVLRLALHLKENRVLGKEKILVLLFESSCVCGFEGERVIEERSC
jgi:hypothetical protein